MENLGLNIEMALIVILQQFYLSEFEIIDGQNQHIEGYTFLDWLFSKELITKEKYIELKSRY